MSWEITSENLYTTEEYDALFSAMMGRKAIVVYFGTKKDGGTSTVANDDFGAWTLDPSTNIAKGDGKHAASYNSTGVTLSGATHGYKGSAFITSLSVNANTGENATFSLTLTGNGKLDKVDVPKS